MRDKEKPSQRIMLMTSTRIALLAATAMLAGGIGVAGAQTSTQPDTSGAGSELSATSCWDAATNQIRERDDITTGSIDTSDMPVPGSDTASTAASGTDLDTGTSADAGADANASAAGDLAATTPDIGTGTDTSAEAGASADTSVSGDVAATTPDIGTGTDTDTSADLEAGADTSVTGDVAATTPDIGTEAGADMSTGAEAGADTSGDVAATAPSTDTDPTRPAEAMGLPDC
jgi:hypothetical protein